MVQVLVSNPPLTIYGFLEFGPPHVVNINAIGISNGANLFVEQNIHLVGVAADAFVNNFDLSFAVSDRRLKKDVVLLDRLASGLGLYRFRYRWSERQYVGVMAQEAKEAVPESVVTGRDGFLRVNYRRLGLGFVTWDAWRSQAA